MSDIVDTALVIFICVAMLAAVFSGAIINWFYRHKNKLPKTEALKDPFAKLAIIAIIISCTLVGLVVYLEQQYGIFSFRPW